MADALPRAQVHGEIVLEAVRDFKLKTPEPAASRQPPAGTGHLPSARPSLNEEALWAWGTGEMGRKLGSEWEALGINEMSLFVSPSKSPVNHTRAKTF